MVNIESEAGIGPATATKRGSLAVPFSSSLAVSADGELWPAAQIRALHHKCPKLYGDSTTLGTGAPLRFDYPSTLLASIGAVIVKGVQYNFGSGGQRADQITARIPAGITDGTNAIVYIAGANDAIQGTAFSTYIQSVTDAINICRKAGVTIFVGTPTPVGPSRSDAILTALAKQCAWLRANVENLGGILIDTTTALTDKSTGRLKTEYSSDETHLTALGYNVMASAVRDMVLPYYRDIAYYGACKSILNPVLDPSVSGDGPLTSGWSVESNTDVTAIESVALDSSVPGSSGRWQEFDIESAAGGSITYSLAIPGNITPNTYALAFDLRIIDVAGTFLASAAAATSSVKCSFYANGILMAQPLAGQVPCSDGNGGYTARVSFLFTSTGTLTPLKLSVQSALAAGQHLKVRITGMSLINLTANGLT